MKTANLKQGNVSYPAVININNKKLKQEINMKICETAYQGIPDTYIGDNIIEANSSYEATYNQNSILSLKFQNYSYIKGAAHENKKKKSITLNLTNVDIYNFDDLFKNNADYKTRIDKIIQRQIAQRNIPMLSQFKGIAPDEEYYLTDNYLIIYYQIYEYTPYYYGILEFKIPYMSISDLLVI